MINSLILDSIFFYRKQNEILKGVYVSVEKGKITALVGRNGSGKSTLLKIAAGQLLADSGLTIIDQKKLVKREKSERFKHISYLPQKSFLNSNLKVNVYLSLLKSSPKDNVIEKHKTEKVVNLSGGIRRYLEAYLILSLNRDYYLLDEPFTGVEPFLIERLIEKILVLKQKNKAVLLTDHYFRYVKPITDIEYVLENGSCTILE